MARYADPNDPSNGTLPRICGKESVADSAKHQVNGDLPPPPHSLFDTILVLDFGSQYVQPDLQASCLQLRGLV